MRAGRQTTRAAVAALLAGLIAVGGAREARAGGATFEFSTEVAFPGQVVTGRAVFDPGASGADDLRHGPWDAYLVPGAGTGSDPFALPPDAEGAVLLGPITIRSGAPRSHHTAEVTFTVPDVAPGGYLVTVCNRPCRRTLLGDLVGGWLEVAADAEGARALRLERAVTEAFDLRITELEASLGPRIDRFHRSALDRDGQLTDRLDRLADRLTALEGRVALRGPPPPAEPPSPWLGGWTVAVALAAFWVAAAAARRRRDRMDTADGSEEAEAAPVHLGDVSSPPVSRSLRATAWLPSGRKP